MSNINFKGTIARSRIKMIAERWTRPMTAREAAIECGMQYRAIYAYMDHLKAAGSLEEVGRNGGKNGGVTIIYKHTGQYSPVTDESDDFQISHAARTPVVVRRHWMDVALFGEARA